MNNRFLIQAVIAGVLGVALLVIGLVTINRGNPVVSVALVTVAVILVVLAIRNIVIFGRR